jgi:DNA-binding NarL/FixJ family response regulator
MNVNIRLVENGGEISKNCNRTARQAYSDPEIASNLQISFTTVRSHVRRIFDKLHERSPVKAATKFVNAGEFSSN